MFGAEPTGNWWRRPVALAGAGGVVAGVVIGGASQSLPAASTHPISGSAVLTGPARTTVTVPVPAPTVTVVHTATRIVVVTSTVSAPLPLSSPIGVPATAAVSATPSVSGAPAVSGAPSEPPGPSAPASSEPPVLGPGPTALCKDGTQTYTQQGGCAHHGGVAARYR